MNTEFMDCEEEIKSVDTRASFTLTTAGDILVGPLPTFSGYTLSQRVGSTIRWKRLEVEILYYPVNTTANKSCVSELLRFGCFWDRAFNQAKCSWSDLFQDQTSGGTLTNNALSNYNTQNNDRFRVLWDDKMVTPAYSNNLSGSTTFDNMTDQQNFYTYKRWAEDYDDLYTIFRPGVTTAAAILTGGLCFFSGSIKSPFNIVPVGDINSNWGAHLRARLYFTES